MSELLPPNASAGERALAGAIQARLTAIPVPIDRLWNPDTCPAALLPWLAWAVSVDVWRTDWPETLQRSTIAASLARHRRKGSVSSIQTALTEIGFAGANIVEGIPPPAYGDFAYGDGTAYGRDGSWAEYEVRVAGGVSAAQFALIQETLATVAPVRCRLVSLTRQPAQGAPVYGGFAYGDGTNYN